MPILTEHGSQIRTSVIGVVNEMHCLGRTALAFSALTGLLPAQLQRTLIATDLDSPLFVGAPTGDATRLLIVERGGLIKVLALQTNTLLSTPFLDVSARISTIGGFGLLGLAFHPDYAQNGFFYINYSRAADGATIIERFQVSADPDVADPASGTIMFGPIAQPAGNHNGGCIRFGPDGYLYVGLGDGGRQRDPDCLAQNRQELLGKMLRIDVDNPTSRIPLDNPFVGDPTTLDEIWAIGLRNPWRFSFDRETGGLYIGDVGQDAWEEIDFQPASSTGGENYGWKVMEGLACFSTTNCQGGVVPCNDTSLTLPVYVHATTVDGCSITGGYVYRGNKIPSLRGTYVFSDYCRGNILTFRIVNGQATDLQNRTSEIGGRVPRLVSFGEDGMGEMYIVSLGSASLPGRVWRIEPRPGVEPFGNGCAGTGGKIPTINAVGSPAVPQLGNSSFGLEVTDARPFEVAFLLVSTQPPIANGPCEVLVAIDASLVALTDASGAATLAMPVPSDNALLGALAWFQWAVLDPAGQFTNPVNLAMSRGLRLHLGN